MTPRRTVIGTIVHARAIRNPWTARALFAVAIAICVFLALFPERHRAAVTLTPTDPASLGLSGTLGQLGAINSVFGNQAAVEIALKVGRSVNVRDTVIEKLKLRQRLNLPNDLAIHRWLNDKVTIRSLRGGIVLFEMHDDDAEFAKAVVGAYAAATQGQLADISRRQTEYKREVLVQLVSEASARLSRAQSAYDIFRLRNRYALPEESIKAIGSQIPILQAAIKAKEVQLNAARQFATDENMQVRQIIAELNSLRAQLAQVETTNISQDDSVGRAVASSTQALRLDRELRIAQSLYDSYMRFLEGTSVEDLTSTANVRVLEAPFVDTERQINWPFAAAALALALLLAAIEFYRLRPPVGDRVIVRETYA
jgi:hypothetical protein